jgi:hypothetical protein
MSAIRASNSEWLFRWSTLSASTIVACYLWWAFELPDAVTAVFVAALIVQFVSFLVLRPNSDEWPLKILLAALFVISLSIPSAAWDARSIWLFHAKRIYADHSLYAQLDGYTSWSHPDYPLLVPSLTASLARCVGAWNEIFPKSATVLAGMPPLLLLAAYLRSSIQQALFACIIVLIPGRALINGYMDGLVALYFTAAALIIATVCQLDGEESIQPADRKWLSACGILLFASLTLLKNEGSVALLALSIAASIATPRETRLRNLSRLWVMLAVAFAPVICWKIACARSGIASDLAATGVADRLLSRLAHPHDWLAISSAMVLRIEIIIPLLLLFMRAWLRGTDRFLSFVGLASLFYSAAVALVYFSTPADLQWHLRTSVERVLQPVALLLLFACLKSLNSFLPGRIFDRARSSESISIGAK